MRDKMTPLALSRLVTAAVALLCQQHPEALRYPREQLRRMAAEETLRLLRG